MRSTARGRSSASTTCRRRGSRRRARRRRRAEVVVERWWAGLPVVNPGRRPTRLGNDGIAPHIEVPDWATAAFTRALAAAGIAYAVRARVSYLIANPEVGERCI